MPDALCHNCRTTYKQPAFCAQCAAPLGEWLALEERAPPAPLDNTAAILALCQAMTNGPTASRVYERLRAAGWELRRA